jgi:dihydrolipoamide dehydrogenase
MENFDVIVIGAGPGGYVSAIRAAQLGKKVAIIEKEHLGGVCLNWGCIPTKSLLHSAHLYHEIKHAEACGIKTAEVSFDLGSMVKRSRDAAKQLSSGISGLLKKNNVTVFTGAAKLLGNNLVQIDSKQTLKAHNIVIATGARARQLAGFESNGRNIWYYKDALMPAACPKSMIIIGSGAIGIEFTCFYRALGVKVTVLEAADRILRTEDKDISDIALKEFQGQGIDFYLNCQLQNYKEQDKMITAYFNNAGKACEVTAEILLVAAGVVPNTENLGLENTKVKTDKGVIVTNHLMQTDEHNIYAIGDVASGPWLAHKASHEGIVAAEHLCGLKPHAIERDNIPSCIYSYPQIASVGLSQAQALEQGYDIRVGKFPFQGNGKAVVMDKAQGMIKTIFDKKTGQLLGAHMIGHDVTELIHGYVIARSLETTEQELMSSIFPHPTLSEAMHESVLSAFNRAIHI